MGSVVSSSSMINRRPRKVMSKTFQTIINNNLSSRNIGGVPRIGGAPGIGGVPKIGGVHSLNNLNSANIRAHLIKLISNMSPEQLSLNAQSLGNLNTAQLVNKNAKQSTALPQAVKNTINVKVVRKKTVKVPLPSLINPNVNRVHRTEVKKIRKRPIITMVPKRNTIPTILKPIADRKRLTMIERLKAIPALSLSAMKNTAGEVVQGEVTNQHQSTQKQNTANIDATKKIKVIAKNNTAEVKIINENPKSLTGSNKNDPNFIVLKDITITNRTIGENGTFNGTKMSVTLMSQATGGRPIVIEAHSNIVVSQEKMPNGTVQFIIKTDTKPSTIPTTTTAVSTTLPTEEPPELDEITPPPTTTEA
ncbi:unnamed protein product [Mytilus coruscus]|uniref:Uncharacterized protein n=1 Tax=Mytilus coruscus TaxID=42192 RepID=A0A6J8AMF9_MYTCO|nr:unnamed protein product [Mytilus coruscus]